jgi:uncharacterized membrane-anchored protein
MAWYNLFTTDYGLMSLAVIAFIVGMAIYLMRKFNALMNQKPDEKKDW